MLIAIIENKEDKIIDIILKENIIPKTCNLTKLKNDLKNNFIDYYDLPLEQINILTLINDVIKIISNYHIHIDSHLFLVIKALITIEGIGRQLDPKFNPITELKPFVQKMLLRQQSPQKIATEFKDILKENLNLFKTLPKDTHLLIKDIKD